MQRVEDLLERALALPLVERVAGLPGVHLVGGAVRDLKLGHEPVDLDFAIEGGDAARLAARLGGPVTAHERFDTASVEVEGRTYDVAATRTETYARPGALPDVAPADLDADLARRDFTVNTFALALGGTEAGMVRSAPGAEEDLAARRLRILHLRSFADDPTRLLRLARYAGRLGFAVEEETGRRATAALADGALTTVSGPRVGAELALLARDADAVAGFVALDTLGAGAAIAPRFGLDGDLARRALALLPADGRADVLLLALACRAVEDPGGLLDRLGFPRDDVRGVQAALRAPDDLAGRPASEIAARLATPEQAALAGALGAEPEARRWAGELRHVRLAVNGEDVIAAGVHFGPEVGRVLEALLALRLDGELPDDRGAQLAAARRLSAG